jgi:predicted dehydrogenase
MTLKLGVIGLSEGNGHPFSWSAICNGYAPEHMADCGYPSIPAYLSQQQWPQDRIGDVQVTHVWTQDTALSAHVARAAMIPHVVQSAEDMLGQVDAVLLARDDAPNHERHAAPFLRAGVPIYIDKPVALSVRQLDRLWALQQRPGQLFTCSALRYAQELMLSEADLLRLGAIRHIQACTPGAWETYAVHVIEPALKLLGDGHPVRCDVRDLGRQGRGATVSFSDGPTLDVVAHGKQVAAPLGLRVHGQHGWQDLIFRDSFGAFKAALSDFIDGVRTGTERSPLAFNQRVVAIIEAGCRGGHE